MHHVVFFLPFISQSLSHHFHRKSWHDKLLRGNYNMLIKQRPNSIFPSLPNYNQDLTEQGFGPQYPVAVARHHIIPYNVLRDFYNNLTERGEAFRLKPFLKILASRLSRYYYDSVNIPGARNVLSNGNIISNVESFLFSLFYGSVNQNEKATYPPCFEIFESFYIFQPGNLFTGPANRSDDPKENFEQRAAVVVGNEQFNILRRVYSQMIAYNKYQPVDFAKLSDGLADIANYQIPASLKASDWFNNGNNKYSIRSSPSLQVVFDEFLNNTENNVDVADGNESRICDYLELKLFKVIMPKIVKFINGPD